MMKETKTEPRAYDINVAFRVLDNTLEAVARCDTKISYLLSAMSLATVLEINLIEFSFFKQHVFQNATKLSLTLCILFLVGAISAVITIILSIYSMNPILKPIAVKKGMVTESLMFFETIKNMTYKRYLNNCIAMSDEELYNDVVSQIYINAVIANHKYTMMRIITKFFVLSFIFLLAFIVLQKGLF